MAPAIPVTAAPTALPTLPPGGELPATGSDAAPPTIIALQFLLAGSVLVMIARMSRRRRTS